MGALEIAANAINAASIVLAGRNSVHTWWLGIIGCALFARLFFEARLYADVTLQLFFIVTSALGWWWWTPAADHRALAVRRCSPSVGAALAAAGLGVTAGYGWLLHRFTDAYAPFLDSLLLAFSVLGQLLLVGRRVESWWCGLLVNSIAVPLYSSRGLYLTAVLYAGFWINALLSLAQWRRLAARS